MQGKARISSPKLSLFLALMAGLLLSACQTTSLGIREHLWSESDGRRVLLMPADIELSVLNAGGVTEPNAAWTKAANDLAEKSMRGILEESSAQLVSYDDKSANADPESTETQLIKLHGAVGGSILLHKYFQPLLLPTKSETFDWTLGPSVRVLRDKYNADYGLFIFIRDSYASGGRAAVIFFAAVLGAHVQGGTQVGFASLVDLKTGEIVWFNRLARTYGDLRNEKGANETIAALFENFPK